MTKERFLNTLNMTKKAWVKCYRAGQNINPDYYPWLIRGLYVQEDRHGNVSLIALSDGSGAEYSPKHDIESFNGSVMVFMAEDYVMEVKL